MINAQKRSTISGYAGLPYGALSQCRAGCVGVVGVPSARGGGSCSGTALAPDALRRMSQVADRGLSGKGCDLGNLTLSGDWSGVLGQLVTQIVERNAVPVVLGGI